MGLRPSWVQIPLPAPKKTNVGTKSVKGFWSIGMPPGGREKDNGKRIVNRKRKDKMEDRILAQDPSICEP